MLLRSSTVPIPISWLPNSRDSSSPEAESIVKLTRTLSCPKPNLADKNNSIVLNKNQQSFNLKESDETEETEQKNYKEKNPSVRELFSSSGLDNEECGKGKKCKKLQTLVMGGGMGCGGGGGKICGGYNGSGRGSDGGSGNGNGWNFSEENNYGRDWTHAYYHTMIQANPNNPLLLGNYAKFLKEVCGENGKAEEYIERAILCNPCDANLLSLYAELIWQTEKNPDRAEAYFDQAVKNAPDDCYVLASYAKFLWDVEDEEDKDCQTHKTYHHSHTYAHHVTAASRV